MVGLCVFLSYPPEHKRWIPHVLSCKQAAWGGVCGTVWVCDVQTPSSGSVAKLFRSSLLSQSSIWCLCLVVERKLWCWALICTWYSRLCAKSNIHVLQNNSVVFFFLHTLALAHILPDLLTVMPLLGYLQWSFGALSKFLEVYQIVSGKNHSNVNEMGRAATSPEVGTFQNTYL